MSPTDAVAADLPLPPAPYVGMRPFRRGEQAIFTGRDGDCAPLANKVFAARLTVLYGPSGVGKSSLLRTLLIDALEDQDARVIYFDEWRGQDPAALLKTRIEAEATALGVPDAGRGEPSLAQLAGLLIAGSGRTLVLVLDQFEEFFTAHQADIEPLRSGLGSLVRAPGLDVRVLLSLREEHLAALEPLRATIPELFQSTYRLEPLAPHSVQEAIAAPADRFGVAYEGGLVQRIAHDLQQDTGQGLPPADGQEARPKADLPLLQLVCDELWKQALPKGLRTIPASLYDAAGGKPGIVAAFLKRVMPTSWQGRRTTAELMRHLAPADGHKVALAARQLASVTELPLARVQAELERLSAPEVGVLRTRGDDRETLYELSHDSFIRLIGPWRDDVLERWRWLRWGRRALVIGSLVIATIVGVRFWEDHRNVARVWTDARPTVQKFDHVAYYLLWARGGVTRLDTLRRELQAHQTELPDDYGVFLSGKEFLTVPRANEDWPLELHYSKLRELNPHAFTLAWQQQAQKFAKEQGIPAPLKIKLVAEATYPKTQVRLQGAGIEPLELHLDADEAQALISEDGLSAPGREFLARFPADWRRLASARDRQWIVPRWSLPVWKASGVLATDGSGILAVRVAHTLRDQPQRLLTRDAVGALLLRMRESDQGAYWGAEQAARAVRGDQRLVSDFQEIFGQGQALTELPELLDILAGYPQGSSREIAGRVIDDLQATRRGLPAPSSASLAASAPAALVPMTAEDEDWPTHRAYRDAAIWLPAVAPALRVHLGKDLARAWLRPDNRPKRPTQAMLDRLGDRFLQRFGVALPTPVFLTGDASLPAGSFRIDVLNQGPGRLQAVQAHGDPAVPLEPLRAALTLAAETHRARWVTASLPADRLADDAYLPLWSWLSPRYGLNDLKQMLRGVIAPGDDEIRARAALTGAGAPAGVLTIAPEHTIRHTPTLLASLAFWATADARSLPDLVRDLRATQRALQAPAAMPRIDADVGRLVDQGLAALARQQFDDAQASFARALARDRAAATAAFLAGYARAANAELQQVLEQACRNLRTPGLTTEQRIDLQERVTSQGFDDRTDPVQARQLRLCLLASLPESRVAARREVADAIVAHAGDIGHWPADDAQWFGIRLLTMFDPLTQDAAVGKTAFALLSQALPGLSRREKDAVLQRIDRVCGDDGPNQWCWDLLPSLAGDDAQTALSIALDLVERETPAALAQALPLIRLGLAGLPRAEIPDKDRAVWQDFADLVQAAADLGQDRFTKADPARRRAAEATLQRLQDSAALRGDATVELAMLRQRQDRLPEATSMVDAALAKWPDNQNLFGARLSLALSQGDAPNVARIAERAGARIVRLGNGRISEPSSGYAFVTALGLLLADGKDAERAAREFLETRHRYTPYVAMLLSWKMAGSAAREARQVLDVRWSEVDQSTWPRRLRLGDLTALREMLIGYHLKMLPREAIFADLEDPQRFDRSDLRHLPMDRRDLLCEAHFYDALHAFAEGDTARARASLERVVATDQKGFFEYAMAKFLLQRKP